MTSIAAWTGLSAVVLFLFANVQMVNMAGGNAYLAVAFGGIIWAAFARKHPLRSIAVRPSAIPLMAFLTYLLLRVLLDAPEPAELGTLMFGTTGGLLFSLLLGTATSVFLCILHESRSGARQVLFSLIFLVACVALGFGAYRAHMSSIREDIFLIAGAGSFYQRPGNFMIVVVLIASALLAQATQQPTRHGRPRAVRAIFALTYVALLAVLMVISQLLGSNTGFVVILFLGVGTLSWLWRPNIGVWECCAAIRRKKFNAAAALRRSFGRLVTNGLLVAAGMSALGLILLSTAGLHLRQFRIFGFSEGRVGGNSLAGRISLLSRDFLTQFAYDPIFGNLKADVLTTGPGTYAHSLISLLSHVGIVGALLFATYIAVAFRDQVRANLSAAAFYGSVDLNVFRFVAVSVIMGFSLIGTFFTWMPLWFSLGLLFPPVVVLSPAVAPPTESQLYPPRARGDIGA